MENFALISLVEELKAALSGMTVKRITRHPGRGIFLQTRSGKLPGLRFSLDARNPLIWVPGLPVAFHSETDDFAMILRKHLTDARLVEITKPLSERIVEFAFTTSLPTPELRHVVLVAELFPNSPNLLLLDQSRRILATALPPGPQRGVSMHEEYRYPAIDRTPLDRTLGTDVSWFDPEAFGADPSGWLVHTLAGMGPVFAGEIASRAPAWSQTTDGIPGGIRNLIRKLTEPARTAWLYTTRPLSVAIDTGQIEVLRTAIVSPIELESLPAMSCQTFPGMLAALRTLADPLESARLVSFAKSREMKRLRREIRKIQVHRKRLEERARKFREASALQATAQLLVASGAVMDRHHASVEVTEYTNDGSATRSVALDPTYTLRENIRRMFKAQRKAARGMDRVERELSGLVRQEEQLAKRKARLEALVHWDDWLAASAVGEAPGKRKPQPRNPVVRRSRYRSVLIDGHEILIGRNSRENDELTFRAAAPDDFWLHVAHYSGSHVILRNPSKAKEPPGEVLVRAAELAAYNSQARNSAKVEVHYTQRKSVRKPRKARAGLVELRQFRTITVEPRDWARGELSTAGSGKEAS